MAENFIRERVWQSLSFTLLCINSPVSHIRAFGVRAKIDNALVLRNQEIPLAFARRPVSTWGQHSAHWMSSLILYHFPASENINSRWFLAFHSRMVIRRFASTSTIISRALQFRHLSMLGLFGGVSVSDWLWLLDCRARPRRTCAGLTELWCVFTAHTGSSHESLQSAHANMQAT